MLCNFKKINDKWICEQCGRINKARSDGYMPSAKCRLPEFYHVQSKFIGNQQIMGVGDFLLSIVKKLNHNIPSLSRARSKITYLNNKGIDWCESHQSAIIEWIKEECSTYKVQYAEKLFKAILRLAIYKAKTQY